VGVIEIIGAIAIKTNTTATTSAKAGEISVKHWQSSPKQTRNQPLFLISPVQAICSHLERNKTRKQYLA
jgi:hypothetical protein